MRALKSVEILGIAVPIIVVSMATKRVPSQRLSKISPDRQEVGYIGVEDGVVAASSGAPTSISSVWLVERRWSAQRSEWRRACWRFGTEDGDLSRMLVPYE